VVTMHLIYLIWLVALVFAGMAVFEHFTYGRKP